MKSSKYVGINPNGIGKEDNIFDAAERGDLSLFKKLFDAAKINSREKVTGKTTLIIAATEGEFEMVKFLCDRGADIDIKDAGGWKALDHAKYHCKEKVVDELERRRKNGGSN